MDFEELRLAFKGARSYLHGTDIFAGCLDLLATEGIVLRDIDMKLGRPSRSALRLVSVGNCTMQPAIAYLRGIHGSRLLELKLVETDQVVSSRYQFDESDLLGDVTRVKSEVPTLQLVRTKRYRDIDLWISMIKHALANEVPGPDGQWLFGRIRIAKYEESKTGSRHTIRAIAGLGTRNVRSSIQVDDTDLGMVDFVWSPRIEAQFATIRKFKHLKLTATRCEEGR